MWCNMTKYSSTLEIYSTLWTVIFLFVEECLSLISPFSGLDFGELARIGASKRLDNSSKQHHLNWDKEAVQIYTVQTEIWRYDEAEPTCQHFTRESSSCSDKREGYEIKGTADQVYFPSLHSHPSTQLQKQSPCPNLFYGYKDFASATLQTWQLTWCPILSRCTIYSIGRLRHDVEPAEHIMGLPVIKKSWTRKPRRSSFRPRESNDQGQFSISASSSTQ